MTIYVWMIALIVPVMLAPTVWQSAQAGDWLAFWVFTLAGVVVLFGMWPLAKLGGAFSRGDRERIVAFIEERLEGKMTAHKS